MTNRLTIHQELKTIFSPDIDTRQVLKTLNAIPHHLHEAYEADKDDHFKDLCNRLDFFEFHFRRYLLGRPKTLHRVFYEVRSFLAYDAHNARKLMTLSINNTRQLLLQQEWYELMPRMEKASTRLRKQFGIPLSNPNAKPA